MIHIRIGLELLKMALRRTKSGSELGYGVEKFGIRIRRYELQISRVIGGKEMFRLIAMCKNNWRDDSSREDKKPILNQT